MTNPTREIHKLWDSQKDYLSPEQMATSPKKFSELLAHVFCPGPFYYYIFDFTARDFSFVHPNIKNLLGIKPAELTIPRLIQQAHPDDFQHFLKCEERIGQFLFEMTEPKLMTKYKVSFCVRLKKKNGEYGQFLHQAIALTIDKNNRLCQTMAVQSDISSISNSFSRKLSFIGLDGAPSYYNLDPYAEPFTLEQTARNTDLTPRESQIVRLLAEGLTAHEIAEELFISFNTVRTHRKNLLQKFDCHNTTHLVSHCLRKGWI